mmetsp:Transcript_48836/g.110824  ORF Transcript_48836/g.110824 Transcript_48836/m.110824 type:complete len:291 (+) Transcript_48836:260-1132(+)|eukprot:CAMPEP_0172637918 /NCGR_PEP_ID=MMETSP1068-20121228/211461_1 /TAXON_ID=35684 /ORGANISM="Pseudopedinella elastica, Strain CCMP716" /LENGTH=290 /DNA_ID=CAMNT_0013450695 /DNA_START=253 /DNA_END=1125 /DNA_ORIENTATION=-
MFLWLGRFAIFIYFHSNAFKASAWAPVSNVVRSTRRSTASTASYYDVVSIDPTITRGGELPGEETLVQGESVILIPSVATISECRDLVSICSQEAARYWESQAAKSLPLERLVRMPSRAAGARSSGEGSYQTLLPVAADEIAEQILKRAMAFIDERLPSLKVKLFGAGSPSLCDLYSSGALEFSQREPAVNVYAPGGEFPAHKDHRALTVLIPISSSDDFVGGGTGFGVESVEDVMRGTSLFWQPSTVLRPAAGTALLFSGDVQHCGVPIEAGERVVLVASFSPSGSRGV